MKMNIAHDEGIKQAEVIGKPIKYKRLVFYATRKKDGGVAITEPVSGFGLSFCSTKAEAVWSAKKIINYHGIELIKQKIKEHSNGKNLNPELINEQG